VNLYKLSLAKIVALNNLFGSLTGGATSKS